MLFQVPGILLVDLVRDDEDRVLDGDEVLEVHDGLVHLCGFSYFVNLHQFDDVVDHKL